MRVGNFLSGILLGVALATFFSSQHYSAKIEENTARHDERVENLKSNYQRQLDALEDVDEECTELFERNIELEVAVIQLEGVIIQAEVKCLWRLRRAEKERCQ